MISKLMKALGTLAVLVLLFLTGPSFTPRILLLVLYIATLTYGISLFFSVKIPVYRRWGIAYLVLTGVTYFFAGILGLLPNWDLIEASIWNFLVSPYPLLTFVNQCVFHYPCTATSWGNVYVFPPYERSLLFSAVVVVISFIAFVAAVEMRKPGRLPYRIWLVLVGISILATLGYVAVGFARWGLKEAVTPLCWSTSYLAAYLMARMGADNQT